MEPKDRDRASVENNHAHLEEKLRSCQSKVSVMAQFARERIEADERANAILDAAVDGIVIISDKGIIQSFNPAAEKIFGYSQQEVTGQRVNILMPEPHRSNHDRYIQSYLDTGQRKVIGTGRETTARRKDGTTFPVELTISEIELRGQRIFTGIVKDISSRHRSASALAASENRFRLLVEAMNDGLAVQDAKGKIIYVNPRFCAILGYEKQCLMGRLVTELMDTGSRIVLESELGDTESEGMVDLKMKKDNGEPLHVQVTAKAIKSPEGELKGSFVMVSDVTQVKKLQHQLLHAQKMEAIGRLAGGIAHDFNNLLTVILGYVDLSLLEIDKDHSLYEKISQIDNAAKRAGTLTRQLLAFSRKQVLQTSVVSINGTIASIENMMQRILGEDVVLRTRLDPATGNIKADEGQIEQVIVNIAVNARDAMPSGGELILETKNVQLPANKSGMLSDVSAGPYVLLSISDTGIGMDQETQTRIFEPFFTTKAKGQGTGLGLSTAYGIIKQSGGDIQAYSEPGHGTCFKIYLPRIDETAPEQTKMHAKSVPTRGSETILVVEDEASVREFVVSALKRSGYQVISAPDGPTALNRFAESDETIDLILTDVVMPHMNGKALVQRIKEISPEIKILYMSGYTDDAIVSQGVLEPGTPFLSKPFSLEALTTKIKSVLLES